MDWSFSVPDETLSRYGLVERQHPNHGDVELALDVLAGAEAPVERRLDEAQRGCAVVIAGHKALASGRRALSTGVKSDG